MVTFLTVKLMNIPDPCLNKNARYLPTSDIVANTAFLNPDFWNQALKGGILVLASQQSLENSGRYRNP